MTDSPTMTKEELAGLLHMQPAYFDRMRSKLFADGMPRPVGEAARQVWSRKNIMAWIDGDLTIAHPKRAGAGR